MSDPANASRKKKIVRSAESAYTALLPGASASPKRKGIRKLVKVAVVLLIIGVMGGGAGIGVLAALMADTPPLDMTKFQYRSPSVILDMNGELYQELQSVERRMPVTLSDSTEMILSAFLALEDQRYYSHQGIDVRGTVKAVFSVLRSGSTDGPGGSTISQQVIKQTHLSSSKELSRKVQEWKLAYTLEQNLSKREIIQVYLNECNMSVTWGIGSAAQMYFGKEVKDLTLAQMAVLAAIVNLPNRYNPFVYETDDQGRRVLSVETTSDGTEQFKYSEQNQQRAQEVLAKMLELGYISQREHTIASTDLRENRINLIRSSVNLSNYSYYSDAVVNSVCEEYVKRGDFDTISEARTELANGGYVIYANVDPEIQKALDHQASVSSNFPASSTQAKAASQAMNKLNENEPSYIPVEYRPEVGAAIVENSTGHVVAIVGGRDEKTGMLTENRALQKKQIGSTTKPITIYSPGFDRKILTLATTFDNVRMNFAGFKPVNYPADYTGMTSCRNGIKNSINIMAVFGYYEIGHEVSKTYGEKFGFVFDKNDSGPGAMALGGYTHGQTALQLASAFSTFPNGGWRITPTFFTKVMFNGKDDLVAVPERVDVISREAAWLTTSAMKEVVSGGTADLHISGQEIAGKTGTTGEKYATLFAGFTARYSGGVWYGYDYMKRTVNGKTYSLRIGDTNGRSGRGPSPAVFWQNVFKEFYASKKLPGASLPSRPSSIRSLSIDRVSGKKPTELTSQDPRGSMVGTEWFWDGSYPSESDDMHKIATVCTITGLLAGPGCPSASVVRILKDPDKLYPRNSKPLNPAACPEAPYLYPTATCSGHYTPPVTPPVTPPTPGTTPKPRPPVTP